MSKYNFHCMSKSSADLLKPSFSLLEMQRFLTLFMMWGLKKVIICGYPEI